MNQKIVGWTLAVGLVMVATAVSAQNPQQNRPATQTPATQAGQSLVSIEGCVTREADLPGHKFDDSDRDDFVLTETRMIKGSAPVPRTAQSSPGDRPTGTSGAAVSMYEIEGIADAALETHAGRRVQIDGRFEDLNDDVVDIRGSAIRQVAGQCPGK